MLLKNQTLHSHQNKRWKKRRVKMRVIYINIKYKNIELEHQFEEGYKGLIGDLYSKGRSALGVSN
jgi:hypothetical protein